MTASSKPPFAGEARRVRLGELISKAKVERCGDRDFPRMLMGYRRSLPEDGAHLWPLDRAEDGKVVPGTSPWDDDGAFRKLRDAGADRVWVTPMVPFVLPIAAAFAIVWIWGNPLFLLI